MNLVHSNVHGNESFVYWSDIVESFFFQKIYFANNLSFLLWRDNGYYFTVYFLGNFINNLEVYFVLMNASISMLALRNEIAVHLQGFYSCKPLYSLVKFCDTSVIFLFAFSSGLLNFLNIEIVIVNFSQWSLYFESFKSWFVLWLLKFFFLDLRNRFWSYSVEWKKIHSEVFASFLNLWNWNLCVLNVFYFLFGSLFKLLGLFYLFLFLFSLCSLSFSLLLFS